MIFLVRTQNYRGDHSADIEVLTELPDITPASEIESIVCERFNSKWDEIVILPIVKETGE